MSEHLLKTIEDLKKDVQEQEAELNATKMLVNRLAKKAGQPPVYARIEREETGTFEIRSDQFHMRPLATVVEEYLRMRRAAGMDPASVSEIFDALIQGGYVFNTASDQNSKISLTTSLGKNPKFYKLPNKRWGLREWYPKAAKQRGAASGDDEETADAEAAEPEGDEENEEEIE